MNDKFRRLQAQIFPLHLQAQEYSRQTTQRQDEMRGLRDQVSQLQSVNGSMMKVRTTLDEIDRLKQEYSSSGLNDPVYLNKLTQLKDSFVGNQYQQPIERTHYYNSNPNIHQRNKQSYSLPSYESHPIYEYLPSGFKQELFEQQSHSFLPHLRNKTEDLTQSKDEQILQYMNNQELQQMMSPQQYREEKLNQIRAIRNKVQNSMINDKARLLMEERQQNNYKYEEQQAVAYSPIEGLIVRFDFVSKLAITVMSGRIAYGFFEKNMEYHPFKTSLDQPAIAESHRTNKMMFQQRELVRDVAPGNILYIEIWYFKQELYDSQLLGWTVFKPFDSTEHLLVGKYKLPFYSKKDNPNGLLSGQIYPYVSSTNLYLRILQPNNSMHDDAILIESDYVVPDYHIHRKAMIIRPPTPKKETQYPIQFTYAEPLKQREPQLFVTPPSEEQKSQFSIQLQNKGSTPLPSQKNIIDTPKPISRFRRKREPTSNVLTLPDQGDQTTKNTVTPKGIDTPNYQRRMHNIRTILKKPTYNTGADSNRSRLRGNTNRIKRKSSIITIRWLKNLPQDGVHEIQIQLKHNNSILQDQGLEQCQAKQEVLIQKGEVLDISFTFNIIKEDLPDDTVILLYLIKGNSEQRWCSIPLYIDDEIITRVEKKMFMPPFQKPPFGKQITNSKSDLAIEID